MVMMLMMKKRERKRKKLHVLGQAAAAAPCCGQKPRQKRAFPVAGTPTASPAPGHPILTDLSHRKRSSADPSENVLRSQVQ